MERYEMGVTYPRFEDECHEVDVRIDPDGKWVRYSEAMEVIQSLQAKIDGMIMRPTIEMIPDPLSKEIHTLAINGQPITLFVDNIEEDPTDVASESLQRITKALGMEGGDK